MIFVVATFHTKPGSADVIRPAAAICTAATVQEEGCISYALHQGLADPDTFVFVERWTTREALEAHFATPHLKAWRAAIADCVISRRVEIIHPDRVEVL